MRRPAPAVIVTTIYSETPIDMALLYPFFERVEKVCQERRMAKSRPENKKNSTKPGVRAPAS